MTVLVANFWCKFGSKNWHILEVKCGAKWDKVVALMDAILDVYLVANMVLTGMSFTN